MKTRITTLLILILLSIDLMLNCGGKKSGDYFIRPVDFTQVRVDDAFWSPRMETNRKVTIPYAFQKCEETHRIDNFAVAGGLKKGTFEGIYFNDSDVYKVIEGAAYALHLHSDAELERYVDGVITKIAAAQEEDGYLYTSRTILNPDNMPLGGKERWSHIQHGHELYNVGHMYEAAVAYHHATGKRSLLDVAIKNADLIDAVFGPDGLRYPPGHQEIEIGLAKLYRLTGEERYLNLAKFFLDERGDSTGHILYGEYAQDHIPVVRQTEAVGHAVRAAYMYTGMADIAALTGNRRYIRAIQTIWEDVISHKLYITGGIGASGGNEGFGGDYHLPNASAYCETCASIANAMWNHRLFLMTGEGKYMDIVERIIYNSFLSGISMKGDRFFYPNRLASYTGEERAAWFGCACCPSNIVRFLPSIPGYVYGQSDPDLYINLYISGSAKIKMEEQIVHIVQESRYPWDGTIKISVSPTAIKKFSIYLRIPGWATGTAVPSDLYHYINPESIPITVRVNDEDVPVKIKDGYVRIKRFWQAGDEISLELPMNIRRVVAHDNVEADLGKIAVERGPIVFCAEGVDNKSRIVHQLMLADSLELTTAFEAKKLNGVQVIKGDALEVRLAEDQEDFLLESIPFKMIPYYSWAHRGRTEMAVWLALKPEAAMPVLPPTPASVARVTASYGRGRRAINDQMEPKSSIDHDLSYFHWWPKKSSEQWIQYTFKEPTVVSRAEVYWFDDTGMGECRVPQSWELFYLSGEDWIRVTNPSEYGLQKDQFNRVTFRPVKTKAIRMVVQSQKGWAGGVHEWILE